MHNKYILLFSLVFVLLMGIFILNRRYSVRIRPDNYSQDNNSNVSDSVIDNEGWITYQNTLYKYQVSYPESFTTQNSAADVGVMEARNDSRSVYIFDRNGDEPYLERYVDLEVFKVDTSSENAIQVEINGVTMKKEPAKTGDLFDKYVAPLITGEYLEIRVSSNTGRKTVADTIFQSIKLN